mmetsp:Transcript_32266/g.64024  ORF Transcript_32266/g.64024 Transcript_32266/m.64024 type:complete len:104 (-) Transcript_32266:314-625(-)
MFFLCFPVTNELDAYKIPWTNVFSLVHALDSVQFPMNPLLVQSFNSEKPFFFFWQGVEWELILPLVPMRMVKFTPGAPRHNDATVDMLQESFSFLSHDRTWIH